MFAEGKTGLRPAETVTRRALCSVVRCWLSVATAVSAAGRCNECRLFSGSVCVFQTITLAVTVMRSSAEAGRNAHVLDMSQTVDTGGQRS